MVRGFPQLTTPLIDLTRKGAFRCIEESNKAFNKLKEIMSSCPVLDLPDFGKPFMLEGDGSGEGIGVTIKKKGHPITFKNQKLGVLERMYSIHEKGMIAIMYALENFRQYLVGNKFIVRIGHNNLYYFLVQRVLNEQKTYKKNPSLRI